MKRSTKIIAVFSLFLVNLLTGQVIEDGNKRELAKNDSIISLDSIQENGVLKAPVYYNATDSILFVAKRKTAYLYNQAHAKYQDFDIKAGEIAIDYGNNLTYAKGLMDSITYQQAPELAQGSQVFYADSLAMNFQTKKGYLYHTKTEDGDAIIVSEIAKRENDSIYYSKGGYYTTDKDEDPDYFIKLDKIKVIKDKTTVSGPLQMYISDVPTPLWFPFGFIPTGQSGTSGILLPSYGENNDLGFFIQNIGYYLYINDYIDFRIYTDIYSKGSWSLRTASSYKKRYRFTGNFNLNIERRVFGELGGSQLTGVDEFSKTNLLRINWSHTQDPKANPNLNFTANVNFANSRYFSSSFDQSNIITGGFQTNTISSSVSLTKRFDEFPFTIALSANHSTNNNSKRVNMSLPNLSVTSKRLFPFAKKGQPKKNIFQNLSVDYGLNARNQMDISEDYFFKKEMFDSARLGMQQRLGIGTSANLLKYLNLSISGDYQEIWAGNLTNKYYNPDSLKVITEVEQKFGAFREFGTSASLSTTLYGMLNFGKGRLKAFRHILRPSVSYNFSPDFSAPRWGYYASYRDGSGRRIFYTPFESSTYGRPSSGLNSGIGISLDNNFEAKVRSKEDPEVFEKINILDQLSISTSYNMAADSLKWSPISLRTSTSLFKNLFRLQYSALFNPYALDDDGFSVDKFGLHTTNMQASLSFGLSPKLFEGKKKEEKNSSSSSNDQPNTTRPTRTSAEEEGDDAIFGIDQYGYATFGQPWSFNVNLNWAYQKQSPDSESDSNIFTLNFNGNIELTPNWSISGTSGYDFKTNKLSFTRLTFNRKLRSFTMNFSWVPFGRNSTYFFTIGIRANILKDLKYDQRSFPTTTGF